MLLLVFCQCFKTVDAQTDSIAGIPQYANAKLDPVLRNAFTAMDAKYLTKIERDIIHVINLMRLDPPGFAEKVVKSYPELLGNPEKRKSSYYQSLLKDLAAASPLPPLKPDEALFVAARCHAIQSGITGYVGHQRSKSCDGTLIYHAECCQYGWNDALHVVMSLLIDENIPNLGHRKILLTGFTHIGVGTRPHKSYGINTVLDFSTGPKHIVHSLKP